MFDIKIGTVLPVEHALEMLPLLKPLGFEGYELTCGHYFAGHDIRESAKALTDAAEGLPFSALGCYGNTLSDDITLSEIKRLIDNARHFGCATVSLFAGAMEGVSVEQSIPAFKKAFQELCARAKDQGVTLAIENCPMGTSWKRGGGQNIAFCPDAWTLLFDAVPDDCLGLEWEPCHALMQLMDPISQLRTWAKKVRHVHGKDGTVAWDVLRAHGTDSGVPFAGIARPALATPTGTTCARSF